MTRLAKQEISRLKSLLFGDTKERLRERSYAKNVLVVNATAANSPESWGRRKKESVDKLHSSARIIQKWLIMKMNHTDISFSYSKHNNTKWIDFKILGRSPFPTLRSTNTPRLTWPPARHSRPIDSMIQGSEVTVVVFWTRFQWQRVGSLATVFWMKAQSEDRVEALATSLKTE